MVEWLAYRMDGWMDIWMDGWVKSMDEKIN